MPLSISAAVKVPSKVTLSKVSASAYNKTNIRWKKATNATHYAVYYRKDGSTKWTRIATVKASQTSYQHNSSKKYPLTPGKKYYYTVRGYNKTTKKYGSYQSKGLCVKIPKKPVPKIETSIEILGGCIIDQDGSYVVETVPGDTLELVLQDDSWTYYKSKWTSSNPAAATIKSDGKNYAELKLHALGRTVITAIPVNSNVRSSSAEISVQHTKKQQFADHYVQKWIKENLTDEMSDYEKADCIAEHVAKIPYGYSYDWINARMEEEPIDCYASRQMAAYMCTAAGIPAMACDDYSHHGETIIKADNQFYMVHTGYSNDYYKIVKMNETELTEYLNFYGKKKTDFTQENKGICDATEHACWDTGVSMAHPQIYTVLRQK